MKADWIDKILMSKWFYFILTIVFIGVFAYVFKWQHFCYWFDTDYQVDHELFGTFGDFIGGVLGTLFAMISIVLLIRTFNQQRYATNESIKLTETQRFNDLFFELLRIYQDEIKELQVHSENENVSGEDNSLFVCNNKDFFNHNMQLMQDKFKQQTSFEKNEDEALKLYMFLYIEYKSKLSIYYRILYRIYDLIDNATNIEESSKKDYLKIIRAQLTESELFFLRYNAMGFYGAKFTTYLNKYNVLKHLPILDLLEFKDWAKDVDEIEKTGINIIFNFIEAMINQKIKKQESNNYVIRLPDSSKYFIRVIIDKSCSRLTMLCFIHNQGENKSLEYAGLDKFTAKRTQALFDCFLKEIFVYKTFKEVNALESLDFFSQKVAREGNVDCIISGVQTKNGSPLKIRSEYFLQ